MENQPIKRNENLIPISREHHSTLLFCWKIKQGLGRNVEPKRLVNYILWYWENHLVPHFASEEKYLFNDGSDSMIQQALQEHSEIKACIQSIQNKVGNALLENILRLSNLVHDHTRYEERKLFPHLENKLSQEEMEKIGKNLYSEHHSADENYSDEFWVFKK